ncbi:LysR family transcriptional regulator [Paenibacillus sp. XY044]|uniref:LysR family transcriptional regulator n=1 Tax=Paenibacillus sp. XY044 TaxID=2026089 RepID=UPI000B9993FC|nr:LysR family transcriptional regulator [Paenibacillus sp. XY044]OZB90121.1 LysR family transcriptional regulator [Paenibacillus sp. XY044]
MEIRQLEYFRAICEELHFTRAADKLNVTQPTLSHQIKSLEDEIGTPLFDRIGKKIALTEAGRILKSHTAVIFNALQSAKDQMNELLSGERGTLAIGSPPGELNHLVSSLLVDFNRKYPNITIKIVESGNVTEKVLNNELDAAVTILPVDDDRLEKIPLYFEQFYLTVSSNQELAQRKEIDFAEVDRLPLILLPESHKCRQLVDATCRMTGKQMTPFVETNSIGTIFNLVKSGAGVSILSKSLIDLNRDGAVSAIPIVNPTLYRQIVIIYNKDKFLSHASRAFISLLQQFVENNELGNPAPRAAIEN